MGSKIKTAFLLGRGKSGINTLLHIPRTNTYRAYVLLTWCCFCPTFSWTCNLGALKRQCEHLQFLEWQTKLWLFHTLMLRPLLYGVETWELSLNKANNWKDVEWPIVPKIACMIGSKTPMPHDIIQIEMGTDPIVIQASFRSMTYIQLLWEFPTRRYSMLALMSSKLLAEHGDIHCWYVVMKQWFESYGISINTLPLFQYSLDHRT